MVLQGNAISKFIRATYGTYSDEHLMDDFVERFTATAPGTALLERLNARINKQRRYKKRAKDAIRQVHTPTEAVCLILKLEMPREKGDVYCYVPFLRY